MKGSGLMEIIVLRRACRPCDIAKEYGVCEKSLMELNGLEQAAAVPAGMSLVLPGDRAAGREEKELYCVGGKSAGRYPDKLSFLAGEYGLDDEAAESSELMDIAKSCAAVPVYSLRARGNLAETRRLVREKETGAAFLESLTERIACRGFGALGLDIPWLLPFDRESFTAFAARAAEAAHKRGLWLICTLPLYPEEKQHQRPFAAYDQAAVGTAADRLILDSGTLAAAEELAAGLEYACALVPGGRLLLSVGEGARLCRGGEREAITAHCARNIAVAAKAKIARRGKGAPAEFSYTDPAGERCQVEYGDALWAREICALAEEYSLAGLARLSGQSCGSGTERVLDEYFAAQEIL